MSISFEVSVLEKEIEAGNFDLSDKVANIRTLLLSEDNKDRFSSKEAKIIALRIWNITVKLNRLISMANESDKSTLRLLLIPTMRILTVDIYKNYIEWDDGDEESKLFYFLSYTYKSLLDADNISLANQYLDKAEKLYSQLNPSSDSALTFVRLKIWQAQNAITQESNYDEALMILKEFTKRFNIISSNLISFIYEKAVESKSIEWCEYCSSLTKNTTAISNEMKIQIDSLLAQFFLINSKPEKAMQIITKLPRSVSQAFLEIKCIILISPNDQSLKEKLISFISQSSEDKRLIATLCLFIADNCENIKHVAIDFIIEAIKSTETINQTELRKHIYSSALRISTELDDINASSQFLKMIEQIEDAHKDNTISDEDRREMTGILWNKALDKFYVNEFEIAIKWMQLSKSQVSDIDNEAQSSCIRFICRCCMQLKRYSDALSFANKAIQIQPSCDHGYLLKFRILIETESEREAFDLINDLIKNSPYLEEFDPSFFTSIASELHSNGNNDLALEVLLKFYQLNFNSSKMNKDDQFNSISFSSLTESESKINNIKKNAINSIFALLQALDDVDYVSNAINILSSQWSSQVLFTINFNDTSSPKEQKNQSKSIDDEQLLTFSYDEICAYSAIAFNNGLELKKKCKLKNAIQSFMSGSLFGEKIIECKASCMFEAIDCYLNLKKSAVENQSLDSPLSHAQSLLEEISKDIENSPNIDQKYKEGLSLANLKINLIQATKNDEFYHKSIELIEDITSPSILCEVCEFIIEYNVPHEIIQNLLERAKIIDKMSHKTELDDNLITSICASLLQQLIEYSKTLEENRNAYNYIIKFIVPENVALMSSSQLQYFMSHAWNIGVDCAKSFRIEDAEWWLKTALNIMNFNEELKSLYADELNEKYSKYIQKSTIFSSTLI